ncbi:hypothetical protein D1816_02570 [Aquimarina sp. AD10]|nr:hypothetical protein D1816_02570 [Aquimarina sp. AD10]RKM92437.1 hypothetical protein D7033_20950 [Aquimarina sp. AD10]
MRKIAQTIEQCSKNANAQTAHLFFFQCEKPTLKKIKELFLAFALDQSYRQNNVNKKTSKSKIQKLTFITCEIELNKV